MRTALQEATNFVGVELAFTEPDIAAATVKAVHLQELLGVVR